MLKGMNRLSVIVAFLILYFFFIIPANRAFAYIPQMAFDELVHLADIVFIGTVTEKTPKIAQDRRTVETQVAFEQIEIIHQKDTVAGKIGNRIILTYWGGRLNEAVTYISDMPRIEAGTRYMVFAYYDGQDHANPFVGGEQGLFKIVVDEITGKQYPLRVTGSGIADVRGDKMSLTRPLKKISNGLPEWKEASTKIKRAPPPDGWVESFRSVQSGPSETLLNVGELTDHMRKALQKSMPASVEKKLQERAALASSRKAASAVSVKLKRPAWEFSADGKLVILDPAKVKCQTPKSKTTDGTGVLNYSRTPMGGTSWEDISIYAWMDLPSTLDAVQENNWLYISDLIARDTYNLYIDDLIHYRNYDHGFGWKNTWSEMCGMLTDGQENDIFGKGWGDAAARTHYTGAVCQSCQIFETDISFNAELRWTTDHTCQLYRRDGGEFGDACKDARLYLKTAIHELGHTLGLMDGGEDYEYDIPTVMNGGMENTVENARGLHVGDTYLLRYWYADQRGPGKMDYDDIGIESWYAQSGAWNATTDKATYSPGDQITIGDITVENIGRHDAPDVRVRAYLSDDVDLFGLLDPVNRMDLNKIPANRLLIAFTANLEYYKWQTLQAEKFWTGKLTFQIPSHIPSGTYRVHLVVTANNDKSGLARVDGDTSYHEVNAFNNHTFLYDTLEVICPKPAAPANFKEQGTDSGGVGLIWDSVPGATSYRVLRTSADGPVNVPYMPTVLSETQPTNTYKDTSADPAVAYYYWVIAQSPCARSDPARLTATVTRPPAAPCIESATDGLSTGEIKITAKRFDMANYFCFYYSDTGNNPAAAKVLPGACWTPDSTALHTNGYPGRTYYYFAQVATSSTGDNASAVGGACPDNMGWRILAPPTGVIASQNNVNWIEVTWSASLGASAYRLYRNTENDPAGAIPVSAWSDRTFYTDYDAEVEANRRYYYWVRAAVGDFGDSPSDFSAVAFGSKAYEPVYPPSMGTYGATDGSSATKITIGWDATLWPQETYYYRVYRSEYGVAGVRDSGDASKATAISGWQLGTSFDDTTGVPGKDYWYWVSSALSTAGFRESVWWLCPYCLDSGWRKLLPAADVTASDGEFSDRIRVTWSPVAGATHYKVYRYTSDILPMKVSPTLISPVVAGTAFDDMDAALVPKTTYYYWVTSAVDADGNRESGFALNGSAGWKEATAPSGVTASAGVYTDKIRVTWSPVSGEVRYQIYRSTTNDPSTATAISASFLSNTTYDDLYANAGQVYYYWVNVRPWPCREGCIISPFSTVIRGGYRALVPPTDIQASDGTYTDKVTVTWTPVSGTYYKVYRNTANTMNGATAISPWLRQVVHFNDTVDVKIGNTYYYFVIAAVDGEGTMASEASVGDSGYRALAPPVHVTATQGVFYKSVGITWNPGAREATHYRVYRSQDWNGATAQPISNWQTATYYDDTFATPWLNYYYWVTESIDARGTLESALSPSGLGESGYVFGEIPGDIDGNRTIELNDAILALQVVTGTLPQSTSRAGMDISTGFTIRMGADINNDGKIGLEEALYILRTIGVPEEPPVGE